MTGTILATTLTTPERLIKFNVESSVNRIVYVNTNPDRNSIGRARNRLLEKYSKRWANNPDIVAGYNLDDDDLEYHTRAHDQYNKLHYEGAKLCFLRRVTLVCKCGYETPSHCRQGLSSPWDYWEQTIMWSGYPLHLYTENGEDGGRGEDTKAFKNWFEGPMGKAHKTTFLDAPELYKYRFHTGNVWLHDHWNRMFQLAGSSHMPGECKAPLWLADPPRSSYSSS